VLQTILVDFSIGHNTRAQLPEKTPQQPQLCQSLGHRGSPCHSWLSGQLPTQGLVEGAGPSAFVGQHLCRVASRVCEVVLLCGNRVGSEAAMSLCTHMHHHHTHTSPHPQSDNRPSCSTHAPGSPVPCRAAHPPSPSAPPRPGKSACRWGAGARARGGSARCQCGGRRPGGACEARVEVESERSVASQQHSATATPATATPATGPILITQTPIDHLPAPPQQPPRSVNAPPRPRRSSRRRPRPLWWRPTKKSPGWPAAPSSSARCTQPCRTAWHGPSACGGLLLGGGVAVCLFGCCKKAPVLQKTEGASPPPALSCFVKVPSVDRLDSHLRLHGLEGPIIQRMHTPAAHLAHGKVVRQHLLQ